MDSSCNNDYTCSSKNINYTYIVTAFTGEGIVYYFPNLFVFLSIMSFLVHIRTITYQHDYRNSYLEAFQAYILIFFSKNLHFLLDYAAYDFSHYTYMRRVIFIFSNLFLNMFEGLLCYTIQTPCSNSTTQEIHREDHKEFFHRIWNPITTQLNKVTKWLSGVQQYNNRNKSDK